MKHVFTVHSPITFLCAYSVCKTLGLNQSDVVIISSSYQPPFEYGRIVKPYHEEKKSYFKKLISVNLPKSYDKYIHKLTGGGPFIAYIDLMHYWQRLLVTNSNCHTFNFLEEGMNSYLKPDTLSEVTFVAKENSFRSNSFKDILTLCYFALRSYNHKLLNMPYWALSYRFCKNVTYYCFSDLCYPGIDLEDKKVLNFKGNNNNGLTLENTIIWIEDIYNKRHVSNQQNIDSAIDQAIKYIHEKYGETHKHVVKLRPNGDQADSEIAPILKRNNLQFNYLKVNEPLELVMERSKNLILISATSSLLFYGKAMGHEAYTFFWLLKNRRHSSFEGMNFYWSTVNKIPENNET